MADSADTIAWLVPKAHCLHASKILQMPENASRTVPISSSCHLSTRVLSLDPKATPTKAIQLSFNEPPKKHARFVLGTDPQTCDILLPDLPDIAPQHCSIGFDGQNRLTLQDFSHTGTQVWYDWDSSGDQRDYSWVLSSGFVSNGFPNATQQISVDIQGLRFQIVVNHHHSQDWPAYAAKIDALVEQSALPSGAVDAVWDTPSACSTPLTCQFSSVPVLRHITVKQFETDAAGDVYVWDLEKPWEPMVKA